MKNWVQMSVVVLAIIVGGQVFAGESYSLRVDGLACPFCAYGIEKQLISLSGVRDVAVDLKAGAVLVTMEDGATLTEAAALQAVKDAGFELKSMAKAKN